MGIHGATLRPRSQETLERMAEAERLLNARVEELRLALIALARAGKAPRVRTYIDAQGWPNDALIRRRFGQLHGHTPKVYANAFRPCGYCESLPLLDGCPGCIERAKIQGPEADIPLDGGEGASR